MKEWYDTNKNSLKMYDGMDDDINKAMIDYKSTYSVLPSYERSILNSIITRGHLIIDKLIKLNTIYKMKNTIDKVDVQEALDLFFKCANCVKKMITENSSPQKKVLSIYNFVKDKRRSKGEIHEMLKKEMRIGSPNDRTKMIRLAMAEGLITAYREGRTTFIEQAKEQDIDDDI